MSNGTKFTCFGFHAWRETPAVYASEAERRLALAEVPAKRTCQRCGKVQFEMVHCLGLNPPQYVSSWGNYAERSGLEQEAA